MGKDRTPAIDSQKLTEIIGRNSNTLVGVILLLAWKAGLSREELCELKWQQIDFKRHQISCSDRAIPLEREVEEALQKRKNVAGGYSDYVVISEKYRQQMAPQSLSRKIRTVLDSEKMKDVTLSDLRSDYIRCQLENHDWTYALQVTGLSVTTYRNTLSDTAREISGKLETACRPEEESRLLWSVLQREKDNAAGIALWLSCQLGLQNEEIVSLTWENIDFSSGKVRLGEKVISMGSTVSRILRNELNRRNASDDIHIIISPKSRKAVTASRLSTMVRTILIRGGIQNASLRSLRKNSEKTDDRTEILAYVKKHGSICRRECMSLLSLTESQAHARLSNLLTEGSLIRVNSRYYIPGTVIPPKQQNEAIISYLAENGMAYCQDIAQLLHLEKRTTARVLKKMAEQGEIVLLQREKKYVLPDSL